MFCRAVLHLPSIHSFVALFPEMRVLTISLSSGLPGLQPAFRWISCIRVTTPGVRCARNPSHGRFDRKTHVSFFALWLPSIPNGHVLMVEGILTGSRLIVQNWILGSRRASCQNLQMRTNAPHLFVFELS